jgi:IS605 OrfB family transposase
VLTSGWRVVNPTVLEKDTLSTVNIEYEGFSCSLSIQCTTKAIARLSAAYMGSTQEGTVIAPGCEDLVVTAKYTDGTSEQIKSSVLHALCCVRYIAERRHVSCVFIEKLKGFLDCKSKALNRGSRAFRRSVHRIPCGELKEWIVRKLTFDGCHVEFVPAAYTSKCAEEYWSDIFSSSHQAAALMIARRGLGLGLFRRTPASPRLSCVIDAERSSDSRDSSASMVDGGRARIGSDCGEEPGQPGDDIRGASVLDGAFLRKLRRTHRLSAPVGGVVPR